MPLRPALALLALAALWGGSYLLIAVGLHTMTPATVTLLRFVPAALLVAVLARSRGQLHGLRGRWGSVALLALVQQAAPMLLIAVGERHVATGLAGTLVASTPLWGALLAPALGGRVPSRLTWAGLLVGLAGVGLLLGADPSGSAPLGCALVLLAGAGYAVGAVWTATRFADVPRLGLLAGTLSASSVLLLPPALLDLPHRLPSLGSAAAVGVLGVLGTGLGFVLLYWLIGEVGPQRSTLVTYLAPAFAVAYGTVLHGEPLTAAGVGGLVLVLGGAWIAARRPVPVPVPVPTVMPVGAPACPAAAA